ncbi:MAG: hypothetical protein WBA25_13795 [Jannaschia sp.]
MTDKPIVLTVGFSLPDDTRHGEGGVAVAFRTETANSQAQAVAMMFELTPAVVMIDLGLTDGSPLAVADFVSYRHPDARVIFRSGTSIFSDGSIFNHCVNAHAHIARGMAEPDVLALVSHHAEAGTRH